jgi:hypothetical protein
MHLEIDCELPGNRWVIVSNADQLNPFGNYPFAVHDMQPLATPAHTLMQRMQEHLQGMMGIARHTLEQAIEGHARQQSLRAAHLRQHGVSPEQWQTILNPMKANAQSLFWRTVRSRVNALLRTAR